MFDIIMQFRRGFRAPLGPRKPSLTVEKEQKKKTAGLQYNPGWLYKRAETVRRVFVTVTLA